jgi:hypothetical protein
MLSPLGRGRSARPSADAVGLAPVSRSAVRRPCTATARPVSLVTGAAGPDLRSSRSGRLPWRRPRDGSRGSVPKVASPGRLLRGGVSGVASLVASREGLAAAAGRAPGVFPPAPPGTPGPGYPARHVALAAGNYRDVTLRWPEQRRCGIAVVAGGVRAGGGLALRPTCPLLAARRPPPAGGGSAPSGPGRWNIHPAHAGSMEHRPGPGHQLVGLQGARDLAVSGLSGIDILPTVYNSEMSGFSGIYFGRSMQ